MGLGRVARASNAPGRAIEPELSFRERAHHLRRMSAQMPTADIDKQGIERIYERWAPIYDLVFGRVFEKGRRIVVAATQRVGGRILDVGVGTGISLPYYSRPSRVVGVDLSASMLQRARQRVEAEHLAHVEQLAVMDAESLDFPAESFDVVTAQHVVSTVPHPERALDEFARVLRPGGEIVLLSRVGADAGWRRWAEKLFQPIATRLGWRSEFRWSRFADWLKRCPHRMDLLERRALPPFGHFSLIRFGKGEAGMLASARARFEAERPAIGAGAGRPSFVSHQPQPALLE